MTASLNQSTSHEPSAARLKSVYERGLIAPEKKPFLIDLARSTGPYMAVRGGGLICDGASQIASLGLGFNAGALFGAAHYLESWTNQTGTESYAQLRSAYERLLQHQLGSDRFVACFCNSGAEANERVLGYCYERRTNRAARRVLAFEGSFHGRMMVALASTWNPSKREPFAWPGFESVFATYPVMEGDDVHGPAEPDGWRALWAQMDNGRLAEGIAALPTGEDALLAAEVESLSAVRTALAAGEVFAILIEPMQCEGGDRYSSRRFHQGLASLSCAYGMPLVYDEIQTGFGLGAEFFWHRKFCLQRPDGAPFFPAGVVCAKKAQAGVALVHDPDGPIQPDASTRVEQTCAASVARGYLQASVLSQFHDKIVEMEGANRQRLAGLVERHPERISRPRAQGLAFAFDFDSPEEVARFVGQRFQHGLLYYPAGTKTARFRMNLGFSEADAALFWERLEHALDNAYTGEDAQLDETIRPQTRAIEAYYRFHEGLVVRKLDMLHGGSPPDEAEALGLVRRHLEQVDPDGAYEVVRVGRDNFPGYRDRVLAMQEEVYEPARRSTGEEFDAIFAAEKPLSIVALRDGKIVAMAFAAPLARFDHMRGVPEDPSRDNPNVYYAVDLTIAKGHRGGLGRVLKQAMTLLALAEGVAAFHGRNRDRMAAGMWAINLSLGARSTRRLVDDYPDEGPHRDCLYYRCETAWSQPPIDLGSGIEAPLGPEHVDREFVERNLPALVNKLTLSNFVTEEFLDDLEGAAHAFPVGLRRLYKASGLSEAVDKIVKVLWRRRQPRTGLLTFEGADFGSGSFLSRSLSGIGDGYFDVERMPQPESDSDEAFFAALDRRLQTDDLLGVFVEPLLRRTMRALPEAVLRRIVATCRDRGVPVVFNDTASLFYRYSGESFGASGVAGAEPDAAIASLGGQTGLVAASEALFLDEPLLLISTWDGDSLSLAQFRRAMQVVEADRPAFERTVEAYQEKLTALAGGRGEFRRGVGSLRGKVPAALRGLLREEAGGFSMSCPSYSEMIRFNRAELD